MYINLDVTHLQISFDSKKDLIPLVVGEHSMINIADLNINNSIRLSGVVSIIDSFRFIQLERSVQRMLESAQTEITLYDITSLEFKPKGMKSESVGTIIFFESSDENDCMIGGSILLSKEQYESVYRLSVQGLSNKDVKIMLSIDGNFNSNSGNYEDPYSDFIVGNSHIDIIEFELGIYNDKDDRC